MKIEDSCESSDISEQKDHQFNWDSAELSWPGLCIDCQFWGPKEAIPNRSEQSRMPCFVKKGYSPIDGRVFPEPDAKFKIIIRGNGMSTNPDFGCVLFEPIDTKKMC